MYAQKQKPWQKRFYLDMCCAVFVDVEYERDYDYI